MDTSAGPMNTGEHQVDSLEAEARGLIFTPLFCPPGEAPWKTVTWERREACITNPKGEVVFQQSGVEVPVGWSQTATNVVASKYFRGAVGAPEREASVRQLVERVVDTITHWGMEDGYFVDEESAEAFRSDLAWLCLHQHLSFNSPVWFNVGVEAEPQCSACFINAITDSMESILELARTEAMLFKYGSGTGSNLSSLRSSREPLRGGGTASGPVSFMRGFDAFAGVIKSGGRTRRAAKMVILNADHPDIGEFVKCKADEELKAHALIEAGYDGSFDVVGGAYDSVFFQNSNNSVRVTDEFMRACEADGEWTTRAVTTGEPMETMRARDLMMDMARAAWACGDPGLQFDSTVNDWNTCLATIRINASNPCSEFMFVDDSACNLASLNLLRFMDDDGRLKLDKLRAAVRISVTAQDIIIDRAAYPNKRIARNTGYYRPLGLGYANLGGLLMARGVAYDSDEGRALAAGLTAVVTGEAYAWSARMAERKGAFAAHRRNAGTMLRVIRKHRAAAQELPDSLVTEELAEVARQVWRDAEHLGASHGYRNAQVTALAPTGTIGFMMDCDTTGVEPEFALVKYKKLVGGGQMKIVNRTVGTALRRLGYAPKAQEAILEWLDDQDTVEGAPRLREEHLPVFDCAFKPTRGKRTIEPMGHLRMMAAVQPFISGAISKTVNVPESSTPEDIARVYMDSWKMGLKAIAVYRDSSKRSQPLSASTGTKEGKAAGPSPQVDHRPVRRKLPDERQALTHKFSIAGHEGYVTVGMYDDGAPGEVFIVMAKEGSTVSGLMDGLATCVSLALQYGVPLKVLTDKFIHTRFEPSGFTGNPEIPIARSILDYIFRWMKLRFAASPGDAAAGEPPPSMEESPRREGAPPAETFVSESDAPTCQDCGAIMIRAGSCYKCLNCGSTSGCS